MFTEKTLQEVREGKKRWDTEVEKARRQKPERKQRFSTVSDFEIKGLYTPDDIKELDFARDIGHPGSFPFTRGCQPTMYRGREWTFRMFSGMGSAEDTNRRWHHLLKEGETGLSTAFDFPTLMGYDSDSLRARGECGRCGVAIDTLRDFEILTHGIPLDGVTTSMTINPPALVLWAMYLGVADKSGINWDRIGGTIQNDMLKEFIAQKTFMLPPEPSIRLISDAVEFGTQHVPLWNTISISGYHIREAGSTAVQEVAFTLANGIAYVEAAIEAGLEVDAFAPRLSFFFNAHIDFFEEIAKFRAARRLWARIMKNRFGAKSPKSLMLRFHTQTAGCTLTAQQPRNNVMRVTLQALSAVLGGTQSLHTNSMDEAFSLPSEGAVQTALRTQQVIAYESGVPDTVDPLGGSFYVEHLTDEIEKRAQAYLDRIDKDGGAVATIEQGFIQKEIQESAYAYQRSVEKGDQIVVGLNKFEQQEAPPTNLMRVDPGVRKSQTDRLKELKQRRDGVAVTTALERLKTCAQGTDNLMPYIMEAVKSYATLGELCDTLREVFGEYKAVSTL